MYHDTCLTSMTPPMSHDYDPHPLMDAGLAAGCAAPLEAAALASALTIAFPDTFPLRWRIAKSITLLSILRWQSDQAPTPGTRKCANFQKTLLVGSRQVLSGVWGVALVNCSDGGQMLISTGTLQDFSLQDAATRMGVSLVPQKYNKFWITLPVHTLWSISPAHGQNMRGDF